MIGSLAIKNALIAMDSADPRFHRCAVHPLLYRWLRGVIECREIPTDETVVGSYFACRHIDECKGNFKRVIWMWCHGQHWGIEDQTADFPDAEKFLTTLQTGNC